MATLPIEVHISIFEGPLDLLLHLVEKRRLPITEVSLAEVADQYLQIVRSLPRPEPDLLADFLLIAGKLLLIKSRAILPRDDAPIQEDDEPARDLQQRLIEYRLFKAAANRLRELEMMQRHSFPRTAPPRDLIPPPLVPPKPDQLLQAMARALKRHSTVADQQVLQQAMPRIQVEERMAWLLAELRVRRQLRWTEVQGSTVGELVATFLSVLELLRKGMVQVDQTAPFAEITITLAVG